MVVVGGPVVVQLGVVRAGTQIQSGVGTQHRLGLVGSPELELRWGVMNGLRNM